MNYQDRETKYIYKKNRSYIRKILSRQRIKGSDLINALQLSLYLTLHRVKNGFNLYTSGENAIKIKKTQVQLIHEY
jgi:hypothetical protein